MQWGHLSKRRISQIMWESGTVWSQEQLRILTNLSLVTIKLPYFKTNCVGTNRVLLEYRQNESTFCSFDRKKHFLQVDWIQPKRRLVWSGPVNLSNSIKKQFDFLEEDPKISAVFRNKQPNKLRISSPEFLLWSKTAEVFLCFFTKIRIIIWFFVSAAAAEKIWKGNICPLRCCCCCWFRFCFCRCFRLQCWKGNTRSETMRR